MKIKYECGHEIDHPEITQPVFQRILGKSPCHRCYDPKKIAAMDAEARATECDGSQYIVKRMGPEPEIDLDE